MNEQSQDLKEQLLQTDEEFHHLAAKHHELEDRLHELTAKHYLSEPEQVEEVTLKKRKLQLKDRMEDILRAASAARSTDSAIRIASTRTDARGRAVVRFALRRLDRPMTAFASIPPAGRSSAARSLAGADRRRGWSAWIARDPVRRARRFLPVLLPRSRARASPTDGDVVLSPADGSVLVAGPALRRRRAAAGRRGSRSASSCRRWTCTSTACRRRDA